MNDDFKSAATNCLPLKDLPAKQIRAVFSDLDDTITENSKVTAATFDALWKLKDNGIWCVIVSGRPAGWADCLMRTWPIDAMVFENGAGLIVRNQENLQTISLAGSAEDMAHRDYLETVFQKLKREIPHLKLASDQPFRKFDYAIDFCEEAPHLEKTELEWVLSQLALEDQLTHKLSSIHVNYWYGTHNKVTACRYLMEYEGKSRGISKDEVVFCGDSPNDEPLFEFFHHTVGVANIRKYLDRMKHCPRYLTNAACGVGFREVVTHLLDRKK